MLLQRGEGLNAPGRAEDALLPPGRDPNESRARLDQDQRSLDFSENEGSNGLMVRTPTSAVCAGLLLLLTLPAGLALASGDVPGVIYMKAGPRVEPLWISAEAASEKGEVRWELFSPYDQDHLRSFLADSERRRREVESSPECQAGETRGTELECPLVLATLDEDRIDPKPNHSFSDLTEQALAIYSGRIEGISQGFFSGLPSSLLQVKVTEAFRSSDLVASDEILIPYPLARFKIGSSTFCGGFYRMFEPAVGDRVLVFIYDPPVDDAKTLVYPRSPELFFQASAGRLIISKLLKTDRDLAMARSLDDLEKLLRQEL
jgi:hypothetical protein